MGRMVGWVCWVAGVGCLVWTTADCAVGGGVGRWGGATTDGSGAGVGTGA